MLIEFLDWYKEQIRAMLAALHAGPDAVAADGIVADADGHERLVVYRRIRGRETLIGRFDASSSDGRSALGRTLGDRRIAGRARVLRVPHGCLLEREISLPIAAERDLRRVIGYELDRLTPFARSDVVWSHAVVGRDRVRGRLTVRLSIIPRTSVAAALAALGSAGRSVTAIEVLVSESGARTEERRRAPRVIPLADGAQARGAWARRGTAILGAGCAALALLVVAVPFVRQAIAMRDVENRIAALRPRVAATEAMRRRIEQASAGVDVIAAEQARVGDALAALAAVTDILPDDTYLNRFTLTQRKLTLNGQSASAARLIAALAEGPAVRNAVFAAPVTRNPAAGTDLFVIQADLVP